VAAPNQVVIKSASAEDLDTLRALWLEYWQSLGFSPGFQNFAAEMKDLPGKYAEPRGRLLIASVETRTAGAAAFRALRADACEAKRLYVRPQYRGFGLGSALLNRLIEEARNAGYDKMYADTLTSMDSAMRLYRAFGFREVASYSTTPTPGAIFLELIL
jgi:GNAT superfamily N-acetyltransferase